MQPYGSMYEFCVFCCAQVAWLRVSAGTAEEPKQSLRSPSQECTNMYVYFLLSIAEAPHLLYTAKSTKQV